MRRRTSSGERVRARSAEATAEAAVVAPCTLLEMICNLRSASLCALLRMAGRSRRVGEEHT